MPYYANGTGRDLYILDLIRGGADHGQTRFNRPVAFYQQKRSNDRNVLPQFAESSRYRVGPFEYTHMNLLAQKRPATARHSNSTPNLLQLAGGVSASPLTAAAANEGRTATATATAGLRPTTAGAGLRIGNAYFSGVDPAGGGHAAVTGESGGVGDPSPSTVKTAPPAAFKGAQTVFNPQTHQKLSGKVQPQRPATSSANTSEWAKSKILRATATGGASISTGENTTTTADRITTPHHQQQQHALDKFIDGLVSKPRPATAGGMPLAAVSGGGNANHRGSLPTLLSDASTLSSFYLVNKKPERVVPLEDMRRLQESLHQGEEGKKKRCIVASQRELNQRMARPRSRDLTSMRVGSRDRLYRNFNSSRRSLNLSLTEL